MGEIRRVGEENQERWEEEKLGNNLKNLEIRSSAFEFIEA